MAIVSFSNRNTTLSKHWDVNSVLFGHTEIERSNWFVTSTIEFTPSVSGIIYYNYLQAEDDLESVVLNRLFYDLNVVSGKTIYLYIDRVTPFSLSVTASDSDLENELKSAILASPTIGQTSSLLFLSGLDGKILGRSSRG